MGDIASPKQLLPLPDGTPMARRVALDLAPHCQALFCTIRLEKDRPLFAEAFRDIHPTVQIHVKVGSEEYCEIAEVAQKITTDLIVQTNGDLIFEPGVIARFVQTHGNADTFVMGREGNPANRRHAFDVINSRISIVPKRLLPLFGTKTFGARGRLLIEIIAAILSRRVIDVPTLFNVDTPADYEAACAALRVNKAAS